MPTSAPAARPFQALHEALDGVSGLIEPEGDLAAAVTRLRSLLGQHADGGPATASALRAGLHQTMAAVHRATPGPENRPALAALRAALMAAGPQLKEPRPQAALSVAPDARPAPQRPRQAARRPCTQPRTLRWLACLPTLLLATSPSQLLCLAGLSLLTRLR